MNEKNNTLDPIPNEFANIEAAADFWDTHSLADYWEQTDEVDIEIRAPKRQWVPLATTLTQQVVQRARQEGISVETLVNLWVAERLQTSP